MGQAIDRQAKKNRKHKLRENPWAIKEPLLSVGRKLKKGIKAGLMTVTMISALTFPYYDAYARQHTPKKTTQQAQIEKELEKGKRFNTFRHTVAYNIYKILKDKTISQIMLDLLLMESTKEINVAMNPDEAINKAINAYLSGKIKLDELIHQTTNYLEMALILNFNHWISTKKSLTNPITKNIRNSNNPQWAKRFKAAVQELYERTRKSLMNKYITEKIKRTQNNVDQLNTETTNKGLTLDPNIFDDAKVNPDNH